MGSKLRTHPELGHIRTPLHAACALGNCVNEYKYGKEGKWFTAGGAIADVD